MIKYVTRCKTLLTYAYGVVAMQLQLSLQRSSTKEPQNQFIAMMALTILTRTMLVRFYMCTNYCNLWFQIYIAGSKKQQTPCILKQCAHSKARNWIQCANCPAGLVAL